MINKETNNFLKIEIDNKIIKKVILYLMAFFIPLFVIFRYIYIFKDLSIWGKYVCSSRWIFTIFNLFRLF